MDAEPERKMPVLLPLEIQYVRPRELRRIAVRAANA